MTIAPFLMGCPPEALGELKVYILEVLAENVDGDYELGWELEDRIAYCHSGYFTDSKKIALAQNIKDLEFDLVDKSGITVFTGKVNEEKTSLGQYNILDFSSFSTSGIYRIKIANKYSNEFVINDNPYLSSIWK